MSGAVRRELWYTVAVINAALISIGKELPGQPVMMIPESCDVRFSGRYIAPEAEPYAWGEMDKRARWYLFATYKRMIELGRDDLGKRVAHLVLLWMDEVPVWHVHPETGAIVSNDPKYPPLVAKWRDRLSADVVEYGRYEDYLLELDATKPPSEVT